ncbi:2-hydroxymuconate tautomerase [Lentilactobacillus buchneri]|uniref:2-hydroxymuconate tautomerase n=1 Tax=Lentilactobacillus buchneri TaxID=1581 RepID=UPI001CDC81D8|nr:2-hydroxymuconate tautomerase [Lentilactobacillus buchneri]MCC6100302.1 4-oxalocrotonate tautomerase [Lactobacillus sp.]MDS1015614.1 2-hydroxymuconate tautomerase [Lentilactobacillus buchneri]WCJ52890.1 4-oxalocrotonate tautomerase [Lentilactobacillus sp. Egmn17]
MAGKNNLRYTFAIRNKWRNQNMPIVDIHLIAGRSQDQLKGLVEDVTAAVVKNTGAPAEHVHVILSEMEKNRYSVGGVLKSDEK